MPPPIGNSYEAYLPGIDGPGNPLIFQLFNKEESDFSLAGMFDPPAKHEEKSWAENMAIVVGVSYVGGEVKD